MNALMMQDFFFFFIQAVRQTPTAVPIRERLELGEKMEKE
jgi:hypothetical protein